MTNDARRTGRMGERGNAIWFILLAIALMAALTMTLTRGSDTGGQSGDIERARVQASEIMRYASGLRTAVDQMNMRGVSENEISFENNFVSGYQNALCPDANGPCRVFGTGGAGQSYQQPRAAWLDAAQDTRASYGEWYITGDVCVQDVGSGSTGCNADSDTGNEDLVLILPWIKQDVCAQINATLSIPGIPVEAGAWSATWPKFQGSFVDGVMLNQPGRVAGCIAGSGAAMPPANTYSFYQVLLAR